MGETEQTIAEQAASPDARAPGEAPAPGAGDAPKGGAAKGDAPKGAAGVDNQAAEVEGDLDELVKTAAERDEYLALAQRTQADFENYRKRVARESAAAQERGMAALAKELLPALDNLDRALADAGKVAQTQGEDDPLLAGVRLVRSELA